MSIQMELHKIIISEMQPEQIIVLKEVDGDRKFPIVIGNSEATAWNGIFARVGTAPEVLSLLNKAMREVLLIPEVQSKYVELGVEAKASSAEELAARIQAEIVKWAAVIEKAGIPKQ